MELSSSSSVVHAIEPGRHSPYNLHHGFLVSRGVVPNDWKVQETEIHMSSSRIVYDNGITLFMDGRTFQAHQDQGLELDKGNVTSGLVVKYLVSVSQDVFDGGSIHWTAHIPYENPHRWIASRFINSTIALDDWKNPRPNVAFQFEIDEMDLYLAISAVQVNDDDGTDRGFITVGCSMNKAPFTDCNDLVGWLSEWRSHERMSRQTLASLMGDMVNAK